MPHPEFWVFLGPHHQSFQVIFCLVLINVLAIWDLTQVEEIKCGLYFFRLTAPLVNICNRFSKSTWLNNTYTSSCSNIPSKSLNFRREVEKHADLLHFFVQKIHNHDVMFLPVAVATSNSLLNAPVDSMVNLIYYKWAKWRFIPSAPASVAIIFAFSAK